MYKYVELWIAANGGYCMSENPLDGVLFDWGPTSTSLVVCDMISHIKNNQSPCRWTSLRTHNLADYSHVIVPIIWSTLKSPFWRWLQLKAVVREFGTNSVGRLVGFWHLISRLYSYGGASNRQIAVISYGIQQSSVLV